MIAEQLCMSRTTWNGYEKGKYEPTASGLQKISEYFEVSIEDLMKTELEMKTAVNEKKEIAEPDNIRILAITVNDEQKQNIELVPIKAIAGYAHNFANTAFLQTLPRFSVPKLREGTYRAFEIKGTSMQPIQEGYIVIGKYIQYLREISNKKRHILLLKEEGLVFKRIVSDIRDSSRWILVSDNPDFEPFITHLENVMEVWEAVAFIGYGDGIEDDSSFLAEKMSGIEQKINRIMDTINNVI